MRLTWPAIVKSKRFLSCVCLSGSPLPSLNTIGVIARAARNFSKSHGLKVTEATTTHKFLY